MRDVQKLYRWPLLLAIAMIILLLGIAACQQDRPQPIVD